MNQAEKYGKPNFRGVFHDGVLTLIRYLDWMPKAWGFARPLIRDNGRAILADFEIVRGDDGLELIVTELTWHDHREFREAVLRFARSLGYQRVWMPAEVIDLDRFDDPVDVIASTTCPACHTVFEEDAPEFILNARAQGIWPLMCPLDGHPVPQWTVTDRRDQVEVDTGEYDCETR